VWHDSILVSKVGSLQPSQGDSVCIRERLWAHRRRLSHAAGLDPAHFRAVIIRTPSPASAIYAEQLLLAEYRCLWNNVITGFGSAGQGSARTGQRPSRWDLMHPGRRAATGAPIATRRELRAHIDRHLATTTSLWSDDAEAASQVLRMH
jgi:hypothetical protein